MLGSAHLVEVDHALGLEVDDELRAHAHLALDVDRAALGEDNLFADAQAQSNALLVRILGLLQLAKVGKEFLLACKRNAAAGVLEYHLKAQLLLLPASLAVVLIEGILLAVDLLVRCRLLRLPIGTDLRSALFTQAVDRKDF